MKRDSSVFYFSATDLAGYIACRHLIELERAVAEGRIERLHRHDPTLERLIQRGIEFERTYVQCLQKEGHEVVNLRDVEGGDAISRTHKAMRTGAGVIVQAALAEGRWRGRADLLLRVDDLPSDLGAWSYEVADTKLARQTKGETILQLALYTDLLSWLLGKAPRRFHVVKPSGNNENPFDLETFRFEDFQAYYRLVRRRLEARIDAGPDNFTYPDPVPHCEICSWWPQCDQKRHEDDHLSLVAGMQRLHREELQRQRIVTLTGFAEREEPLDERPERGSRDTFLRLHGQARIQLRGRRDGSPVYELLTAEQGRGLSRLPTPAPGDVFFDIESDPFVGLSGLEFVFGYVISGENGPEYSVIWARNEAEEKKMFERFIDCLMEHWECFPGMHIYHFSPYEPAALKRLMGQHGTREDQVDRLLRAERFIDLHAVTRQGLRLSVESYSLKELEPFYGFERDLLLDHSRSALQRVNRALEFNIPEEITEEDDKAVEAYNRDDCLSTLRLRDWLEERRLELIASGVEVIRPELKEGEATERLEERREEVQTIYERLVEGLPEDPNDRDEIEQARSLLANLLDYFRREDRCSWWEFFRIRDLGHEDLLEERKAVSGLEFLAEVEGGTQRCPVHRYRYPNQEVAISPGDALFEVAEEMRPVGSVYGIDLADRTLDIKKRQDSWNTHPSSVTTFERISPETPEGSILAFARSVISHGLDGDAPFRAARDLLLRRGPRIEGHEPGRPLRHDGETAVEAALRIAPLLRDSCLPIQGPPGTGKTFTGARMIASLLSQGKRVGVTAVSHAVIRNLLEAAIEASDEMGTPLEAVHKPGNSVREEETDRLKHGSSNAKALAALDEGKLVGGTCWLWASNGAVEQLDYLFVDEAGQLSLAMMLAAARSARNLVLLGDPQQLEQPQQASHPEGAQVSALEYVLEGRQTIRDDRGLFLDKTWRLHPAICAFTSELYYEGRLESREGLERQAIGGKTRSKGSGLFLEFVEHQGNQNSCIEEVEAIRRIVDELLTPGITWIDDEGAAHELTKNHILVIAPYNAQVGALISALPAGIRVGTVDKFQGQEAPVVIYSMTSSSANDAPRGMSFLYNPNRFNVATSRARCICIAVGSPNLFEPDCRRPEQMRWANALCRFREMAAGTNL